MKSKRLNKRIDLDKEIVSPDKNRLWEGIEPYLLTDNLYSEKNRVLLIKGIKELPVIKPQQNIWLKLSTEIKPNHAKYKRKLQIAWVSGIAASLIMAMLWFPFNSKKRIEDIDQSSTVNFECGKDLKVNDFVAQICLAYPNKCTSSDFLELKTEILTLQLEKEELKKQIFYNPGDPTINDLCTRIDDQIDFLKAQMKSYVSL